jgi:hypothetical protein
MQAACLAFSESGKGKLIHNTFIRGENRAGQLLAELARTTPAKAGKSAPVLAT